jgi:hypothetical protein
MLRVYIGAGILSENTTLSAQGFGPKILNAVTTLQMMELQLNKRVEIFENALKMHTSGHVLHGMKKNASQLNAVQSRNVPQNTTDKYSSNRSKLILKVRCKIGKTRLQLFKVMSAKAVLELRLNTWYCSCIPLQSRQESCTDAFLQEIR